MPYCAAARCAVLCCAVLVFALCVRACGPCFPPSTEASTIKSGRVLLIIVIAAACSYPLSCLVPSCPGLSCLVPPRFVGDMWLDAEEDPTAADTQSNSSASDTIAPMPTMKREVQGGMCASSCVFDCAFFRLAFRVWHYTKCCLGLMYQWGSGRSIFLLVVCDRSIDQLIPLPVCCVVSTD